MSSYDPTGLKGFYKTEIAAALTFAGLSFGAFSKAEKERTLAEKLGPGHPAYKHVMSRVSLPEGAGKAFGATAVVVGAMGFPGLIGASCPK
jgi:hypothetical protein